jgi:hypothetical protein
MLLKSIKQINYVYSYLSATEKELIDIFLFPCLRKVHSTSENSFSLKTIDLTIILSNWFRAVRKLNAVQGFKTLYLYL